MRGGGRTVRRPALVVRQQREIVILAAAPTAAPPPLGATWEGTSTTLKAVRFGGAMAMSGGEAFVGRVVSQVNGLSVTSAVEIGYIATDCTELTFKFVDPDGWVMTRRGRAASGNRASVIVAGAAAMVKGCVDAYPLPTVGGELTCESREEELRLLPLLACCRLATSATMGWYTYQRSLEENPAKKSAKKPAKKIAKKVGKKAKGGKKVAPKKAIGYSTLKSTGSFTFPGFAKFVVKKTRQ
eukprot:gene43966-20757_t